MILFNNYDPILVGSTFLFLGVLSYIVYDISSYDVVVTGIQTTPEPETFTSLEK